MQAVQCDKSVDGKYTRPDSPACSKRPLLEEKKIRKQWTLNRNDVLM